MIEVYMEPDGSSHPHDGLAASMTCWRCTPLRGRQLLLGSPAGFFLGPQPCLLLGSCLGFRLQDWCHNHPGGPAMQNTINTSMAGPNPDYPMTDPAICSLLRISMQDCYSVK